MKTYIVTLMLTACLLAGVASAVRADAETSNEWVNFKGDVTFNGEPAPVGSRVDAYDSVGTHCGTFTVGDIVDSAGIYGYMSVYRDDHSFPDTADEGAEPGESIFFKVNGRWADSLSGNVIWGVHGDTNTVDLYASGTILMTPVVMPTTQSAAFGDTVRCWVGVRNDGDGLDFYGITSTSFLGWETVNQDSFSYADIGDTAWLYFDVITPIWPGWDTLDNITFSVFSYLDTSQHVDSTVDVIISFSDVAEPFAELPGHFQLLQNFPNPFNPNTTISFTLAERSAVMLEVYNVLGQVVESRDLGVLPADDHSVEYDASDQASGVYFYRLTTESGSQSRKMVLLK